MVLPLPTRPGSRTVSKGSTVSLEVYLGSPFLGAREEHQGCYGGLCASLGCEGLSCFQNHHGRPRYVGFWARWGPGVLEPTIPHVSKETLCKRQHNHSPHVHFGAFKEYLGSRSTRHLAGAKQTERSSGLDSVAPRGQATSSKNVPGAKGSLVTDKNATDEMHLWKPQGPRSLGSQGGSALPERERSPRASLDLDGTGGSADP